MTSNRFTRSLSLLLVFAILVNILPASVFAVQIEDATVVTLSENASEDIFLVGEVESLREENTKHFRLSDGSFLAVSYGVPVHYQNESGVWQDIDNTFTEKNEKLSVANADTEVIFSGTLTEGKLFSTVYQDFELSFSLLDPVSGNSMVMDSSVTELMPSFQTFNRDATAEIVEAQSTLSDTDATGSWSPEDLIPANLQSTVLYENIYPGVDLLYSALSYHIKEQIIVKEPQDNYTFSFLVQSDDLVPRMNADGSVSLLDKTEAEIYRIPAPYMEDSNGARSTDVHYTLQEHSGGIILTVTADTAWINDPGRSFPVSIDPTLIADSNYNDRIMYTSYVMEKDSATNRFDTDPLYIGGMLAGNTADTFGRFRTFLHFHTLPDVPDGASLVDAKLFLCANVFRGIAMNSFPIGAYPVSTEKPSEYATYKDWFKAICWNNMPAYDENNMLDYVTASSSINGRYQSWDLTEAAQEWYFGGEENATIALAVPDDGNSLSASGYGYVSLSNYASANIPMLIVSYRNTTGIEPYYTYRTLNAGAAGTAYIADATGQLRAANTLVSYASSVNPVSLNLVYNSDRFTANSLEKYCPPEDMELNMDLGYGWTLDCVQQIEDETLEGTSYKRYVDGDGTEHYFARDTEKDPSGTWFYDEDGLGLKIKKTADGAYTMSDDKGNSWYFTDNLLRLTEDADGNKIYINYTDGKRLNTVTQINNGCGEVVVARFAYDGENRLISVTDAAGIVYYLEYDEGRLYEIKQGNALIARYVYMGNRLRKLTDVEREYSIFCTYDSSGRISMYQEIGKENDADKVGATVAVTYPHPGKTIYRDYGADRKTDADPGSTADDNFALDDLLTNYLFDDACRTVNVYTTTNGSRLLGASNAAYTGTGGTDKRNNRTAQTASIGTAAQQLLRNTGFESTAAGLAWTLSGTDISVSTETPRTGAKSLRGLLAADGMQSARRVVSTLTTGLTYTFSAYIRTTDVEHIEGEGIYLKVTDTSGNTWLSEAVDYATPVTVDSGWTRIHVTFTAKTDGTHTLTIVNDGVWGKPIYVDDIQLERSDAPSNCNLVDNGGMQLGSVGWTLGSNASIAENLGNNSTASLKIKGTPTDASAYAYQDIPINLPGSQTYVLSGWGKANAVPDNVNTADDPAEDTYKQFGLRAVIYYADDTTETHYAPFNPDFGLWQFTSLVIVPKKPTQTVEKIRVYCTYQCNANTAWFDNISLLREVAQTMTYDDDGNLKSVTTTGLSPDVNTFDENSNLIKTVTGGNGTYQYSYDNTDNEHQLTEVKLVNSENATVLKQAMDYDSVGNVTSTTLSGTGKYTMTAASAYTGNKNRLLSVTDATGVTVTYGYGTALNQMWALPSSVAQPLSDTQTLYTRMEYDDFGRTTKTSIASTAKTEYNYTKGNLASILRTDDAANIAQRYNFTHDGFGNMTAAKVGNVTLASYTYAPNNGDLLTQTYANGDSISYTYDLLGRVKTASTSDGRTLTYSYSGDGQLSQVTETQDGKTATYVYNYDSIGRLISLRKKVNGDTVLLIGSRYNSKNQLIRNSWRVGSAVFSQDYTYNTLDGSINTVTMPDQQTLTMGYDSLRRLSTVTGGVTAKRYLYRTFEDNTTTDQVTSLSYTGLSKVFQYSYDIRGNIAAYTAPGKSTVTYTYDKQGQLLSASNGYSYTYDNVGNILTATKNGTTHTYTYSTYDWKDKLISYDGQAIAYDASGNPTSYYNGTRWTFGWENGRELVSATSGNTNLSFAYDGEGVRTSKTVNGVEHKYYYSGGKLLRETYGGNILDFAYNPDGTLYSFRYNQTYYYYVTNLQGDVISIVDADGNTVASYEYDPYGNIVGKSGTLADTNPLRYRGYYYDTGTNLYYLQSRYYDPELGRFINADAFTSTGQGILGNNMFAYCGNNPVMCTDHSGHWAVDWDLYHNQYVGHYFAEWYINSDAEEVDDDNNLTRNAKIKQSIRALATSIEFVFGVGLGMYGGINAYDFVNLNAGIYADLFRVTYVDGQYDLCQYGREGIDFSAFFINVIPASRALYKADLTSKSKWREIDEDEVYNLLGGSAYFFGGATVEINWDAVGLIKDWRSIWR